MTTLEGSVQMPGVDVELLTSPEATVLARTVTDSAGRVVFPDVPAGAYTLRAIRVGFLPRDSSPFTVTAGRTAQVLLDIQLTFAAPAVEVRASSNSPTNSVRPVSMSDMVSGSVLDLAPLEGDDFQSLLPLLPGVVRGPDGRLRIKGGQPTQGALQVSSASLVDPSSGEFDFDLPGQSVESVEVLANPFAAEYGRFTTSVTQIRTRRGTNDWEFKPGNLMPRFRGAVNGIRGFEPRFSIRGPLQRDRFFLAQDFQFRYVATPVRSLPEEPEIRLTSFDSFTRIDGVLSTRHTLGGGVISFPRKVERTTMNTFRPVDTTPTFRQEGLQIGIVDRFAIAPSAVLETTLSARTFEIDVVGRGTDAMVYAPASQTGSFFNDQERNVGSWQLVEALSLSRDRWAGEHVMKFGVDVQRSSFDGFSSSRPVEIRRVDGSLAERITFDQRTEQQVSGLEFAAFAQDRWRVSDRLTIEAGLRFDKDQVSDTLSWSPRAGAAWSVLAEGRGILRGGVGTFVQRTPLNVAAFSSFESRLVTRFGSDGTQLGPTITLTNVTEPALQAPRAYVGNLEWNQRYGRRLLFKAHVLARQGSREFIVSPESALQQLRLSSAGRSTYREAELTGRYLGGPRRDLTLSYVWSRGRADLNSYEQFFGNLRNPIIRANERSITVADAPHRLLLRGTLGLPAQWDFAPVLEIRSGFPWSAVDESLDFVGTRNRAGRFPRVSTLDFAITRPWRLLKYRFRAGLRVYNVLGASADRDVQANVTAPDFGSFYNPIERSIGITFGSVR